jgi:undecaprenyl-diphosphatase
MHQLNVAVFYFFHNFAGKNIWLDFAGIFLANYMIFLVIALIAWYYVWGKTPEEKTRNKMLAIMAGISGIISRLVVGEAFKAWYFHPRPFIVLGTSHLIPESGNSFPSGHTIFLFGVSTTVYMYNKPLGIALLIISALVGIARIYTGVHWPGDILGGAVMGVIIGWATYAYLRKLVYRYLYQPLSRWL